MSDRDGLHGDLLKVIAEDISAIRANIGRLYAIHENLREDFNNHRVHVEGRLSKVETRASLLGAALGAAAGAVSVLLGK